MKLVIAEKASLARSVSDAITGVRKERINELTCRKGDYIITFLAGHIMEHLQPDEYDQSYHKWRESDLPIYFENWRKKVSADKRDIYQNIKSLIEGDYGIDTIIHAGDMDAEGQLLVDEVLQSLGNRLPVWRLNTADTTPESLRSNLSDLRDNSLFAGLADNAEARSVADMIFGFSHSRLWSIRTGNNLSIGRVKTPTLRLVVNRDREIENFVPCKYISIYFSAENGGRSCKVKVVFPKDDDILDRNDCLSDEKSADDFINEHLGKPHDGVVESNSESENPPLPFNLETLQSLMEKQYGYTPGKTMEITQSLRDRYNCISYNRSECEYLPSSYFAGREKHIATVVKNIGGTRSFRFDPDYRSKCFDDEKISLHFGIIPQNIPVDMAGFSVEERNCYIEICRRFLMQFMGDSIAEKRNLTIQFGSGRIAKANSKRYVRQGWMSIKQNAPKSPDDDCEEDEMTDIPFGDGAAVFTLVNPEKKFKETKAPKRYTQASLIHDMCRISRFVKDKEIKELLLRKDKGKTGDRGSIGTTATRAPIIETMIRQGYLKTERKHILSTELARKFIDLLPESVKSIDTTARWFAIQEKIESGEAAKEDLYKSVIDDFNAVFHNGDISFKMDRFRPVTDTKKEDRFFETESFYCYKIDDNNVRSIYKDNNFFNSLGYKPGKRAIKSMLVKGIAEDAKLKSRKTGKEFVADIKVEFEKVGESRYLKAKYSISLK